MAGDVEKGGHILSFSGGFPSASPGILNMSSRRCYGMKDSIKVVFIGLGGRGRNMMSIMLRMPDVEIVGVCDLRPEMLAKGVALVKERRGIEPMATADYQELLRRDEVDAVMVTTGWNEHLELCAEAMLAGKYVATEVGGANSLEQCWEIVRASERSKMPCMMLETALWPQGDDGSEYGSPGLLGTHPRRRRYLHDCGRKSPWVMSAGIPACPESAPQRRCLSHHAGRLPNAWTSIAATE